MPVQLNQKPEHSFDQPIGLLSDCHRRIEHFLGVVQRVLRSTKGKALDEEHRRAINAALKYFDEAAPRHTADEEESLFPRLRAAAEHHPALREALSKLDNLEADHDAADRLHSEMRHWCLQWLDHGLAPPQLKRLSRIVDVLATLYRHHIAIEDNELFPLAASSMGEKALRDVGGEMALRRGLELKHT